MEDFPLKPYDALMLVVLISCTVFGAWKGVAWQIAALASLVVSGVVAINFSGPLTPYFGDQAPWNRCLAMLVLYLITGVAIWLLFRVVASFIDRVRLKEFDRQIGAIFGAAKGLMWCLLITFFSVTLSEPLSEIVLDTRSGEYATRLIHFGSPLLTVEVHEKLSKYIEQFHEKAHPDTPLPEAPGASEERSGESLFR
ncbi:MAG: CvpA family protein [Thermoguttaceae bacterium]